MPKLYDSPKPVDANLRQRMEKKGTPAVPSSSKKAKKKIPPRPTGAKSALVKKASAGSSSPKPKKKIAGRVDKKKPKK